MAYHLDAEDGHGKDGSWEAVRAYVWHHWPAAQLATYKTPTGWVPYGMAPPKEYLAVYRGMPDVAPHTVPGFVWHVLANGEHVATISES